MKKLITLLILGVLSTSCIDAPITYPIKVRSVETVRGSSKYKVGVEQSDYSTKAYIYTDTLYNVGSIIR